MHPVLVYILLLFLTEKVQYQHSHVCGQQIHLFQLLISGNMSTPVMTPNIVGVASSAGIVNWETRMNLAKGAVISIRLSL